MKDIKSYVIGFLTCACMFLIMGQMPTMDDEKIEQMKNMATQMKNAGLMPEPVGRYQAISGNKYEFFYLLNTRTGEVYNHIENPDNTYKKRLADVWNKNPHIHGFSKP